MQIKAQGSHVVVKLTGPSGLMMIKTGFAGSAMLGWL